MRLIGPDEIATALHSPDIHAEWPGAARELDPLFTDIAGSGSINPGDRRALFHLVRYFRPKAILEIGTNVAGSTTSMALALRLAMVAGAGPCSLTTVDKNDVNVLWGGAPRDHIAAIRMSEHVGFIISNSATYLGATNDRFDFIFVDGKHTEEVVRQDVIGALRCLNPDGVIVLHDYFPGAKPLWSNAKVIPGPFMAIEQLRREGAGISALPLGELPWPTKLGSNVTSLAVLSRADRTSPRSSS
jgi:predicted O-methyltransferase YrrM